MDSYYLYCHTSPDGKRYVGITKQNPFLRWLNGNGYKNNTHFWRAIQKYGWINFKHEILREGLSKEEAEELEIRCISELELTNSEKGYNIASGGLGGDGFKGHHHTESSNIILGNGYLLSSESENTGEPFCILVSELILITSTAGTHTLKLTTLGELTHKLDPKFIGNVSKDGTLSILGTVEFAADAWDQDFRWFTDTWLNYHFDADISLEINGQLFEHLPFTEGSQGAFTYGDVDTIGVEIENSGRGSTMQSVYVSTAMFPDGIQSAHVYRVAALRIPEEALPVDAEWITQIDGSEIVLKSNASYVHNNSWFNCTITNTDNYSLDITRHALFLLVTPSGKSLIDVGNPDINSNTVKTKQLNGKIVATPVYKTNGELVSKADWPMGATLIATAWTNDRVYLLNPRV